MALLEKVLGFRPKIREYLADEFAYGLALRRKHEFLEWWNAAEDTVRGKNFG